MPDNAPPRRYAQNWAGRRQRLRDERDAEIEAIQPALQNLAASDLEPERRIEQLASITALLASSDAWKVIRTELAEGRPKQARDEQAKAAAEVWRIRARLRAQMRAARNT